ncbi:MAG: hypothetical protein ACRD72_26170, partial [Candidatus Angelobacter sp.]
DKDQEAADRINGKKVVTAAQAFPWKKLSSLAVPAGIAAAVLAALVGGFTFLKKRRKKKGQTA